MFDIIDAIALYGLITIITVTLVIAVINTVSEFRNAPKFVKAANAMIVDFLFEDEEDDE